MLFGKTVNNRTSYRGIMASLRYVRFTTMHMYMGRNHDVYWDNSVPTLSSQLYACSSDTSRIAPHHRISFCNDENIEIRRV